MTARTASVLLTPGARGARWKPRRPGHPALFPVLEVPCPAERFFEKGPRSPGTWHGISPLEPPEHTCQRSCQSCSSVEHDLQVTYLTSTPVMA